MYLWWDELMGSLGSTQENLCHLWKDNSLFKMSLRQSSNYYLTASSFYLFDGAAETSGRRDKN